MRDPCLSIKGLLAKQASTSFACMEIPFESAFGVEQSLSKQCKGLVVLALGSDDSRLREYCSWAKLLRARTWHVERDRRAVTGL